MNNPKVSIALPVYNGEPFLGKTLDAILAQTFADFELLICDNASTDATEKICRQYAARDERISYYRNQRNIGAAGNFNQVFQLSSGEYFKWAAHDDLHAADYLARCIEVLDSDRSVVLCHSLVQIIDQEGKPLGDYTIKLNTDADNPVTRFGALLSHHLCYPIFGLIRANVLEKTSLMGSYGHADGVLLASIALQGRFYEIPKPLFFARNHPQQSMSRFFPEYLSLATGDSTSVTKLPDYYAYAVWFDPANRGRAIFPHWRIFCEYCRCIWQASLSAGEKIACLFSMFKQLKGMEFLLLQDLIIAARQSLDSAIASLKKTLVATVNLK
jgi:glycosyltransferase involved in cell wall biosynthesis